MNALILWWACCDMYVFIYADLSTWFYQVKKRFKLTTRRLLDEIIFYLHCIFCLQDYKINL